MAGDALLDALRSFVGVQGPVQVARHSVNEPAIADWCDAMGDNNPRYPEVAPPATLDIWDRPGLPAQSATARAGDDPRSQVLRLLEAEGFVGVVAVNSELEIARYLRPGDVVRNVQVLEDVSEEKQTALGSGHFVTTRHRYTVDGEHVGDLLFRILKFKPGTGTTAATATKAPDRDPALRPRPSINRDNVALWDGYREHELRVPRCEKCGRVFFPPSPRCADCGSFAMGYVVSSGRGSLYSFVVVHHPQVAGFGYPLPVGLVELDDCDGVRLVADLVGVGPEHLRVGLPVEVTWLDAGDVTLPQFRPATPSRRDQTLHASELQPGDPLPLWALPVTPTQIVAGALATRDFQDVHHDRDLAVKKGSKDIFFNINTSLGLMQRFVTDWSGPDADVTALRVRLGAPAYPGVHLSFSGSVTSVDASTGRVVVGVQAVNELGPHITGTAELVLPR